jgi:hypothetical protein
MVKKMGEILANVVAFDLKTAACQSFYLLIF